MPERPKKEVILQHNAAAIEVAVNLAVSNLLPKINFNSKTTTTFFYSEPQPCKLLHHDGNYIDARLKMTYKKYHNNFLFLIDISFPDNLDNIKAHNFDELMSFEECDIAYKGFLFRINNDPQTLKVTSNQKVKNMYRKTGVGTALLVNGESAKMLIAKKLAAHLNITKLHSVIEDTSWGKWTSRQVRKMLTGYISEGTPDEYYIKDVLIDV